MVGAISGAELMTRTVVVDFKYFCTKNVVTHRKLQIEFTVGLFNNSDGEKLRRMCGIDELSRFCKSKFPLQTANITCSFLTSHQNSKANLTEDNQKRGN